MNVVIRTMWYSSTFRTRTLYFISKLRISVVTINAKCCQIRYESKSRAKPQTPRKRHIRCGWGYNLWLSTVSIFGERNERDLSPPLTKDVHNYNKHRLLAIAPHDIHELWCVKIFTFTVSKTTMHSSQNINLNRNPRFI